MEKQTDYLTNVTKNLSRKEISIMSNLIIYYSRKGQNYLNGSVTDLAKGNTERVAKYIRNAVDCDLFEIETVKEYAKDYTRCTEEAKDELRQNARPELKRYLSDISQYDNIVVAGPCWWGTYRKPDLVGRCSEHRVFVPGKT